MSEHKEVSDSNIDHATLKLSKISDLIEENYQKPYRIKKNNITANTPHWDEHFNLAFLFHNTAYHQSTGSTLSGIFYAQLHTMRKPSNSTIQYKRKTHNWTSIQWSTKLTRSKEATRPTFSKFFYNCKRYDEQMPMLNRIVDDTILDKRKYNNQTGKKHFQTFLWNRT